MLCKNLLTNALADLPALFGHVLHHQPWGNGVWKLEAIGCNPLLGHPLGATLGCGRPLGATLGGRSLAGRHGADALLTRCGSQWNGEREALP